MPDAGSIGEALFGTFRIEVPIIQMADDAQRYVRISAQRYNTLDQYARLADALLEIVAADRHDPAVQIR
jgi:isopenicillin-N epimerase